MSRRYGFILAVGALMAVAASNARLSGRAPSSGYHEFTLTAKDSGFEPNLLTVNKDEKVRLIITATDCEHEFRLDAFDINQVLQKGNPEIIEFTASKAGTFQFKCSVYCGKGHGKMHGKLVVL